jgi:hypothetical protein
VLQLRDDVCSNVGTNAKLSSVFEKANTNAAYPYNAMNFIPALGMHSELPIAVRSGAESLKGSLRLLDRRIFLKSLAPLSLIKAFRINLISAESISQDNTFKLHNVAINYRERNLKRQKYRY